MHTSNIESSSLTEPGMSLCFLGNYQPLMINSCALVGLFIETGTAIVMGSSISSAILQ